MTATVAPSPWSAPARLPADRPWRFGRVVRLDGADGLPDGQQQVLQWQMKRNCSIAPRQLGAVYAGLCGVSLLIAAGFALQGAPFVLGFAFIEVLVVGLAFLLHALHAADRETLTLIDRTIEVERQHGRQHTRVSFPADWLTVEPSAGQGSLIELSAQGRRLLVGRFLRPELRAAFAQELRLAVRRLRQAPIDTNPESESK